MFLKMEAKQKPSSEIIMPSSKNKALLAPENTK